MNCDLLTIKCPVCGPLHVDILLASAESQAEREELRRFILEVHKEAQRCLPMEKP